MVIKHLSSIIPFSFYLLFLLPVFSQTETVTTAQEVQPQTEKKTENEAQRTAPDKTEDKNYLARETENGDIEIVQTITWDAAEYVRFYEVTIERQNETGSWEQYAVHKTETNSLELNLDSGEYRYRVALYNLLGKKAFETEPEPFTVKKAFFPSLTEISPAVIYLDDIFDGNFTVKGTNLLPSSVFSLEKANLKLKTLSASAAPNGRSANISFSKERFDLGKWLIKVENPGGFLTEIPLEIRFAKWFDLTISAGYKPLFVLFDDTIKQYFGTNKSLLGAEFKTVFIPYKRQAGFFGAGLNFTYHRLGNSLSTYELGTNLYQAYAFFVYRLPIIKNRLILDAHIGPGILAVQGLTFLFENNIRSEPFNALYISAGAGLSFQLFVYKRLYIEAGVDFAAAFMPDMSFVTVMPTLSVGWQF